MMETRVWIKLHLNRRHIRPQASAAPIKVMKRFAENSLQMDIRLVHDLLAVPAILGAAR